MAQITTQMLIEKISQQAVQIAQLELTRDALLTENAQLTQALAAKEGELQQPEVSSPEAA